MTSQDDVCLQCGETRGRIRREGYFCATVDYFGEVEREWPKHRFRPWTEKELEQQRREEEAMAAYWNGFADWWDAEAKRQNEEVGDGRG